MTEKTWPVQSSLAVGMRMACPRCGTGRLFRGFLTLDRQCGHCGLDFAPFDSGDGPAVFVILIVGFIVVGMALYVEVAYQPSYWIHAALWFPLGLGLPLLMLRPLKAWLVAQQYKHKAAEGRVE